MVATVAVVERILLYLSYRPVTYHDTGGYRRLAGQLLAGWDTYDGTRMPGYPVFLTWFGPDERVYMAQLVLGVLTTLLLFFIGWRMTRQGWFAALAAFAYTLNPQQVLVEADLLTETLTIFFLALCLARMVWLLTSEGKCPLWQVVLAGLGVGAAVGFGRCRCTGRWSRLPHRS